MSGQRVSTLAPSAIERLESRALLSASFVVQHNLVSDGAVAADHVDKNLKNPWGLAADDVGPAWVANNGTHTATLYNFSNGQAKPLVVKISGADNGVGEPTGEVYNVAENAFLVSKGGHTAPAKFIFAGEDGTISAWTPIVDATHTVVVADRSAQGAVYKGLTLAASHGGSFLYAADFVNRRVDVFDSRFHRTTQFGNFVDPSIPSNYSPFNVQAVGTRIVVTYAKQVPGDTDEAHGAGFGFVSIFSSDGKVVGRLQHTALLNAPWGITRAPSSWHELAGDLLIGQFATGQILAYNMTTGKLVDVLHDSKGKPIAIDGLWSLQYGNEPAVRSTLFFTAGINDEADGLFGSLKISP